MRYITISLIRHLEIGKACLAGILRKP